ncbi:MAG: MFS transporter [Actinomycetia bacterium]|nr:MFS transporter [Actinomycetes bacterium]
MTAWQNDRAATMGGGPPVPEHPVAGGVDSARAWAVVAGTFISTATIFGITYSFGTFLNAMADEFDSGNGSIALMFSLTIFFLFVLGLPAGRASDRWGPRPVVVFGLTAIVSGLTLTSFVQNTATGYLTYGFGVGVGVACCYVPLVSQVSGWFDKQRTTALGVAVSGIGAGTMGGPPIVRRLVAEVGWRDSFRILAVVALVGLLIAAMLIDRAPLMADQDPPDLRRLYQSSIFRNMYGGIVLMSLALFVPIVFVVPYAEDHGISTGVAATLLTWLGSGSLLGRILLGPVAGKVGVLRLYQLCLALLGASYAIWLFAGSSYALLALFSFVLGAAYGGFVAVSPAAAAELFGLAGLGGTLGSLYTGAGVGGLFGPPIAGALIDATDSYRLAIIVALVLGLVSALAQSRAVHLHEQEPAPTPLLFDPGFPSTPVLAPRGGHEDPVIDLRSPFRTDGVKPAAGTIAWTSTELPISSPSPLLTSPEARAALAARAATDRPAELEPEPSPQSVLDVAAELAASEPAPQPAPLWDEARQAWICWEPARAAWLQYDQPTATWVPITR